jgi:hypothetical protein
MNGLTGRGFAPGMDGLDGGLSAERMAGGWLRAAATRDVVRRTIAQTATVHVANRYFSFGLKTLFLPGFHGAQPGSAKRWCVMSPRHWRQNPDESTLYRLIALCSLTLICSSLIQRLTLAAAFAAAFFMGDIPTRYFL